MATTTKSSSVRPPAWDEEKFSRTPESVEEALRMVDLDWEVATKKIAWLVKGEKGKPDIARTIDGWVAYVHSQSQEVVHVAKDGSTGGHTFQFQPNREAFAFIDDLLQRGLTLVAGGEFSGPHRSWLLLEIDNPISIGDDLVKRYVVVVNSHDEKSLRAIQVPVRVLSQTLLSWELPAASRTVALKHGAPENGLEVLRSSVDYFKAFEQLGKQLAEVEYKSEQLEELAIEMFPIDETSGPRARLFRDQARLKVLNLFRFGKTIGNAPETAWAALNALAEYEDWFRPNLRVSRLQRAIDDISGDKQKVLSAVLDKTQV